jgi:membrane-associated protease RseP (regulator of RpoE activity)
MKHILRPYQILNRWSEITLAVAALCLFGAPRAIDAQARSVMSIFANPFPSLSHTSQGYLGVDLGDIDQDKAQQLKLKDVRGAVITLIDHDAPAGKIGLKVNDVVLSLNGQTVEGAEQLKRMLHEIPAGRKVSLEISRDGNIQTLAVELADREAMERDVWDKIDKDGDLNSPAPGMGILGPDGDVSAPPGFHMPFFGSSLKVGALVEPLTSQMADYLGVNGGLMVKQVGRKTEAANAGLRAFDVILKVGSEPINTSADWERALRANEGKQVQVTILRDKKQQTLNLQVDSKRHSELEWLDVFGDDDPALVAENDLVMPEALEAQTDAAAAQDQIQDQIDKQVQTQVQDNEQLRKQLESQADELRNQIQGQLKGLTDKQTEQLLKQAEQMAQQAGQLQQSINPDQFKVDPRQMQQLQQQMDQLQKNFNSDQFKQQFQMNQKQMDQFRQQMQRFKMDQFKVDPKAMQQLQDQMKQFKVDPKQMEELQQQMKQLQQQFKDQMENWQERQSGHFV